MTKKIIKILMASLMLLPVTNLRAQTSDTLFPYPTIPEGADMSLSRRCDYLVYNFWDRCNIKESFSTMNKLNDAFGTWISFMPYAAADTVHMSIDRYIKAVNKQAPKEMLKVARMAESWLYCDTAQYYSEEIYEPFCQAVIDSKKVGKAEKEYYKAQLLKIQSSGIGKRVPGFAITTPDGQQMTFDDVIASRVILFFNDPDCVDCVMAKARLAADFNTKRLIDMGLLKIASIYPGGATDEWKEAVAGYPENWVVGAADDVDLYFELPEMPTLYYLDGKHKVIGKNFDVDNLLQVIRSIYNQQQQPAHSASDTDGTPATTDNE